MRLRSLQRRHRGVMATGVLCLGFAMSRAVLADPPVQQLHEVNVIAVAPLAGFDVPVLQIPLNVQSAQADDVQ